MTTTGRRSLALAAVFPILALAACGGHQTTASKSAAAFDAAVQKGEIPAAGAAHGGHGRAAHADSSPAASDNNASSMAGMDHSRMPGMETASRARPKAGAGSSMAGVDHSAMPGMDHTNMAAPPAMKMAPPAPEPPAAPAKPGPTAATLRPNELDQPPVTSLREAARAAAIAQEMAGPGHGMTHGTYRQIDAGRDDVTPTSGPQHERHQAPSTDPQQMHSMPPSPRPTPSPHPEARQQ